MIRKAGRDDLPYIAGIYERIHDAEERERQIGWLREVYPTEETARQSIDRGDMYVFLENDRIVAAAVINKIQVDVYAKCDWQYEASDDEVSVMHTLTVDPPEKGRGIGKSFVADWEKLARDGGCAVLRLDANSINTPARNLYKKCGFTEAGTFPCVFNGIPGINLVCMEKKL